MKLETADQNRIQELLKEREEQDIRIAELELELNQVRGLAKTALNNQAQSKAKYARALKDVQYYKELAHKEADERYRDKLE